MAEANIDTTSPKNQPQTSGDTGSGRVDDARTIGDFGDAVGAAGSGGPDPFGGAAGSSGGPTPGNLADLDLAGESPAGPGTSTRAADIGSVSG